MLFYTKERCELCERAWMLLEIFGAGSSFKVKRMDVEREGGPALRRYRNRVPVVKVPSGKELDLWIDPAELEEALREVTG